MRYRIVGSFVEFEDGTRFACVAGGKGPGTSSTTVQTQAPKDDQQIALETKQLEMADLQLQEVKRQNQMLMEVFPQQKELLTAQIESANQLVQAQKQSLTQAALLSAQQMPYLQKQTELATEQLKLQQAQLPALQKLTEAQISALETQTGLSKAQLEAQQAQLPLLTKLSEAQISALEVSTGLQKQQLQAMQASAGNVEELTKQIQAATQETPAQQQIRELSESRTLAYLKGEAPPLSEAQSKQIDVAYRAAAEEGSANIRQFAEEMAASRGMGLTDSPIGAQVLPEVRRLQQSLEGAKAQAQLNLGTQDLQFNQAIQQFQAGLKQQAFQNRLALTGSAGLTSFPQTAIPNVGLPQTSPTLAQLPLPGMANPLVQSEAGSTMQSLQQLITGLNAQRPITKQTNTTGGGGGAGGAMTGALSGAATGATVAGPWGAVGGGILGGVGGYLSSARYKRNILPLDEDEYDAALKRVRETPITRYRYKWEGEQGPPHIGPILELAPPEITDDGHRVNLLDYAGLQHAALKAVDRQVENLSRTLVEMIKEKDGTYAYSS